MELKVASRVKLESESVARPARTGVIEEVVREAPSPRYRVRWDDGHESIYTPAAGALHSAEPTEKASDHRQRAPRRQRKRSRGGPIRGIGTPSGLGSGARSHGRIGRCPAMEWRRSIRALPRLPQSSAGHAPFPGRRPTRSPAVTGRLVDKGAREKQIIDVTLLARGAIGGAIARQCERRVAPERPCQQPPLPPRSDVRIACPVRHRLVDRPAPSCAPAT